MIGILVLAIPVSVVGSIFTELYSATKRNQKKQKQENLLLAKTE
jgi:hypothetical protein